MTPAAIQIREVGPRDGLQNLAPLPPELRVRMIEGLALAGLREIEAASFVSPSAVPAMAGAADVVSGISPELRSSVQLVALVPNVRGAQLALATGIDALNVTLSASETYNQRNVRRSIDESVDEVAGICKLAAEIGVPVDATISCAFGSPYEGDLSPEWVASVGKRALVAGAVSVTYADTTGMATPRRVRELIDQVGPDVRLHLHETRGTGLVNAYSAWQLGVTRFDASVGGLGGSPFASGSGGNVATEGLVHLFDDLGVDTGVILDRLLEVAKMVGEMVEVPLPSPVAAAGPRSRLAPG